MRKHILYLASGSSRRFGENKLLYPVDGIPMFLHGLTKLHSYVQKHGDCTLTVVSRYEKIRRTAEAMGISAADSPKSALGIANTIRAGIEAAGEIAPADFLMFAVADQPYLTEDSVGRLLECAKPGCETACLAWNGRPGNPTLFCASCVPELLSLTGDTGGRAVLRRHDCIYVQAREERELDDVDTPGDLFAAN